MTSTLAIANRFAKAAGKIHKRLAAGKLRGGVLVFPSAVDFYQDTAKRITEIFPTEAHGTDGFTVEAKETSTARAFERGTSPAGSKGADGKEK